MYINIYEDITNDDVILIGNWGGYIGKIKFIKLAQNTDYNDIENGNIIDMKMIKKFSNIYRQIKNISWLFVNFMVQYIINKIKMIKKFSNIYRQKNKIHILLQIYLKNTRNLNTIIQKNTRIRLIKFKGKKHTQFK